MDSRLRTQDDYTGGRDDLPALDSREDTRVPNSPVLPATKSTSASPLGESPEQSVNLDALEKGHTPSLSTKSGSRLRRHFREDIQTEWADVLLLFCWFTTGFLDSTIFDGMAIMLTLIALKTS